MILCSGREDCPDFQCPHCGADYEAVDWDDMDGVDVSKCKMCEGEFIIMEHVTTTYEVVKR